MSISTAMRKVEGFVGKGEVLFLDPSAIKVKYNPRKNFNPKALAELKAQVRVNGITENLQVYHDKTENCFVLVSGERRLRVVQMLQDEGVPYPTVPCDLVEAPSQSQIITRAILANDGEPLNVVELADAYQLLIEDGKPAKEIADSFGKTQAHVSQLLRLAACPDKVKADVIAGRATMTEAVAAAREAGITPKKPKKEDAESASNESPSPTDNDTSKAVADTKAEELVAVASQKREDEATAKKKLVAVAKSEGVELSPDEKRIVTILAKHGVDGLIAMAQRACQLHASLVEDPKSKKTWKNHSKLFNAVKEFIDNEIE